MKDVEVYFVHSKYLYELMLNFSICRHVNWTDNGLKITLCQYYMVGQFDNITVAMTTLANWDGNQVTEKIGRSVLRVGDVFKVQGVYYLFVCKRLVKIPDAISNRLIIK